MKGGAQGEAALAKETAIEASGLGMSPLVARMQEPSLEPAVGVKVESSMWTEPPAAKKPWAAWIAPPVILVVLSLVTVVVWHQQVDHQRALLQRHSEDFCAQSLRRLQVGTEFAVSAASVFARRWASHETRDFSVKRFVDFGTVLVTETPGFRSVRLIPSDRGEQWVAPLDADSAWADLRDGAEAILAQSVTQGTLLSEPVGRDDRRSVFVVVPVHRDSEFLGWIVAELDAATLIDAGFHGRGDPEFAFWAADRGLQLFAFRKAEAAPEAAVRKLLVSNSVKVRNRTWTFTAAPLRKTYAQAGWVASLPIPILGFLASFGLSALVHQLARRAEQYRRARDKAVAEVAERQKAEAALRESESRYRSVFQSATDGLIVVDDDRIVEANAAACEMHGVAPGELDGRSMVDLIAAGYRHLYVNFKKTGATGAVFRVDSKHVRRDGSLLDVEVRATRFMHGGEQRMLVILADVTERNRALQRLEHLSREVLMAQEEERARVSRDLHDELGQLLTASRIELGLFEKRAAGAGLEARDAMQNAVVLVEKAADELRRICRGLRPPLLDDLGLEPAVRLLVREFEDRTGIESHLQVSFDEAQPELSGEVSLCAYRILQEALNNVSRHSEASTVDIALSRSPGELVLSVRDDGKGFDPAELGQGCGIAGMRERAGLVNGSVEIHSARSQGTRVVFRVHLDDVQAGR